jgi:hypothetical protein
MEKDNFYYFMKDVLKSSSANFESNFYYVANHHLLSKEAVREILVDEVNSKKPDYKILIACLKSQNSFLYQSGRGAVYEVIEIVESLKKCLNSKFLTVKNTAGNVALNLFAVLYFEYVIMPGRKEEGKEYIEKFRKYFSAEDMFEIINRSTSFYRFVFERQGIELGIGHEVPLRLEKILRSFYSIY